MQVFGQLLYCVYISYISIKIIFVKLYVYCQVTFCFAV